MKTSQSYEYNLRRASEIINDVLYATVATADKGGKPWNSPVAKFYDKQLNIYWFYDKESQHSTNIRDNKQIFICIYDSTMAEGTGEAVYIEAEATEINDPKEVEEIVKLQTGEWKVNASGVSGKAAHRFYKAMPKKVWVNDVELDENGDYVRDIKVELGMKDITKAL